jgi:glycine/D-amino acid oxidase-like deaminating enzyme
MKTRIEGRCFWLQTAIQPGEEDAPALSGNTHADVCIVGGGYAGMWTALELKRRQPTLDVAIVEADICGGGASGRNSGMVLPQWAKFQALQQMCGTEGALHLCRASSDVLDELEAFCTSNGIAAEFRRDGWIWGATCEAQVGVWQSIVDALNAQGEDYFRPVGRGEIAAMTGSDRFLAGIHTPHAATLNPGKLVRGLRRVVLEHGVRIFENSPMTALERCAMPRVRTAGGSITAERVVLTMNAWMTRFPELRPGVLVIASDDAMTAPIPDLLETSGYRNAPLMNDSQIFVTGFRTTADHRLAPGITGGIVGYGGLGAARFEGPSVREAAIRDCLRRGLPRLADVPFVASWYGPIDRTRTGLPLFGALPGSPNIFYGYGFSGNGVCTTPIAGRILASLALGLANEWSSCGLVRPVEAWMPPEPFKYLGALMVRAAIRRKDALGYRGREPGPITRRLAALAPGGVVTTPQFESRR